MNKHTSFEQVIMATMTLASGIALGALGWVFLIYQALKFSNVIF